MRKSKSSPYFHLQYTFSLVLCIIFLEQVPADPEVDEFYCNRCIDPDGNPCNDVIRRVASSKFWLMKGDKKGSFQEAQNTCQRLGFGIAEINSEADQIIFGKLATSDDRYWIGFVRQQGDTEWTKTDASPLQWQAPAIEEDIEVDEGGMRAISVDTPGVWYSSSVDDRNLIVCQFAPTSPCFRGNVDKPEPMTPIKAPTPGLECEEPKFEKNQMLRTGPNSKFLYPKITYLTSATIASTLCGNLGLDPAIIEGRTEFKHLVQFVFDMKLNNTKRGFKLNIGAINSGSGVYIDPKRTPPKNKMRFQAFNLQDKQYFAEDGNCLALEFVRSQYFYTPTVCNKKEEVMPLCQYKPEKQCSSDAPTTLNDGETKMDKLVKVGETITHAYFGSMKQKTWHEAQESCTSNSLKLLSFPNRDPLIIKDVLDIVDKYRDTTGARPYQAFSWTSGSFIDDQIVVFDSGSEPWNFNEYPGLQLNDYLTVDKNKERCLVFTADGLRPIVCDMPNYFICYGPRKVVEPPELNLPLDEDDLRSESDEETDDCFNAKLTISFTKGGLTIKDIVGLMISSKIEQFSKEFKTNLPINEKSTWRINHINRMQDLTKRVCPAEFVPPEFIHLISNFLLIYFNSIEELERFPKQEEFYAKMNTTYKFCKRNAVQLSLGGTAGLITEFTGGGRMGGIRITNETADGIEIMDYILEGQWYMLLITAATCYNSTADRKTYWLTEYFSNFRKDFTQQLKQWWVDPGDTNYGLLFGDIDLYASLYNLRACATAAFEMLDKEDLLFVRPVDLQGDRRYFAQSLNERT